MFNANDDSVYADFHFSQAQKDDDTTSGSGKSMNDKAEDILNDDGTTNPLGGLTVVNAGNGIPYLYKYSWCLIAVHFHKAN